MENGIRLDSLTNIINKTKSNKEKALAHIELGEYYTSIGKFNLSIIEYKKAIIKDQKNSKAHLRLGNAYRDLKEFDAALKIFKTNLKYNPKCVETHQAIGKLNRDLKQYSLAIEWFEKALSIDSMNAYSYSMLGILNQQTGNFENALKLQKIAVNLEPENGMYWMTLGSIYDKIEMRDLARINYLTAKKKIKKHDYYNRACLEALLGNSNKSLELLSKAIEERPYRKEWAKSDPDLKSIRHIPKFSKIISQ